MRRIPQSVIGTGITAVVMIAVVGCTGSSSDNTDRKASSPTSKSTIRPTDTPSASPGKSTAPKTYTVKPATRTSSFDVRTDKSTYRVTFKRGELTEPSADLAAITQPSNVAWGNNLGTPLGSACKGLNKKTNRVFPFSITVEGLTKRHHTPAFVKFMPYTTVAGTKASAPKGSVQMEFTQSSNKQRCYNLDHGTDAWKAQGITFSIVTHNQKSTLTGWFILGGEYSLADYQLGITSISPHEGGKAHSHKGEFTPFQLKNPDLSGGTMPLLPNK